MPNEPNWISSQEVIRINELQVGRTGEPHGVLQNGGLDGAVARPRQLFVYGGTPDVLDMALSLLFGIAKSHAFVQGNKRTGFAAALVFMERNGYTLEMPDDSIVADAVIRAIGNHALQENLRGFLAAFVRRHP